MPEDSEEEGRVEHPLEDAFKNSSTAAVETVLFGFIFFVLSSFVCLFFDEMLFLLKEEMALQELTRRLATVITHVGKWNYFTLRFTNGGWGRTLWALWPCAYPQPSGSALPGLVLARTRIWASAPGVWWGGP